MLFSRNLTCFFVYFKSSTILMAIIYLQLAKLLRYQLNYVPIF